MKSIIWSLNSEADLDEIFEFISKNSPQNAVNFIKGLNESGFCLCNASPFR
jgi:plasmid stabilization system protein ParE